MELKEKLCLALGTRLAHCTNELVTTLRSADKITISQHEIYNRERCWSCPAANALANAFAKVSAEPADVEIFEYWSKFSKFELIQILKACTLHDIYFSKEELNTIINGIMGAFDKVDLGDCTPIKSSNISIVE